MRWIKIFQVFSRVGRCRRTTAIRGTNASKTPKNDASWATLAEVTREIRARKFSLEATCQAQQFSLKDLEEHSVGLPNR